MSTLEWVFFGSFSFWLLVTVPLCMVIGRALRDINDSIQLACRSLEHHNALTTEAVNMAAAAYQREMA